jgi:hypothetical protein
MGTAADKAVTDRSPEELGVLNGLTRHDQPVVSTARKTGGDGQREQDCATCRVVEVLANIASRRPIGVLAALLLAFAILQLWLPLRTAIQIGDDEGFELAKATLCLHGHNLYTEVWNDQPPLHTFLISQILKHLSPSIVGPRLVTSLSAALLLTSIFIISLRINGWVVAALTTALLIASPGFIELSSSCMLEIPALAPAVAALGVLLVAGQTKRHTAEVLSGILFGLAFQVKLVNVVLLPLAALIIWMQHRKPTAPHDVAQPSADTSRAVESRRVGNAGQDRSSVEIRRWFPANITASLLILTASLTVSFAAIDYGIDRGAFLLHFQQSWVSHFAPTKSFEYGSPTEHSFDWSILIKNWDATLPAIFGLILSVRQRCKRPAAILPVAWLALTLLVFAKHKPWWTYYYVHNAIPLCWCAAIGVAAMAQSIHRRRRGLALAVAAFGIAVVSWLGARLYLQISGVRHAPRTYSSLVLRELGRLKPLARFIYTDQTVYSFHSGIPLPPDLAVLPLKRFWSGDMTNARLAAEISEVKPEVILLRNDTREVPFQDLIDAEYRVVYQDTDHRLYTKKLLAKAAGY